MQHLVWLFCPSLIQFLIYTQSLCSFIIIKFEDALRDKYITSITIG